MLNKTAWSGITSVVPVVFIFFVMLFYTASWLEEAILQSVQEEQPLQLESYTE